MGRRKSTSRFETSPTITVLTSFPRPRPTTNPYIWMLASALRSEADLEVVTFSWRAALLGHFDVFHAHWPEILVSGRTPARRLVRQSLFLLLLGRLVVTRRPLVRTLHNLELPRDISRREVWLLRRAERLTSVFIRLNEQTPQPSHGSTVTILHGHYADWFGRQHRGDAVPGQLGFFGLVRRYKGVDVLVEAFASTAGTHPELRLDIAGSPSSDDLAHQLEQAAAKDPRMLLHLAFLTDDELVAHVTGAELVVLPYREMHNSGGALAALSLRRPVLVPRNEVTDALAEEVGGNWVHQFEGALTGQMLVAALDAVRDSAGTDDGPDLRRRSWQAAGGQHVEAYRLALGQASSPR